MTQFINFSKLPNVDKNWKWFFVIGLFLLALGFFAIGYAKWATEFTVILLGIFLAGAGILQLISSFYASRWSGFTLSMLLGAFYLIAGAICILKPMEGAVSISLLISALLLVGGVYRLISAFRYKFENWGWVVFNGITSIFLGLLIIAGWPADAVWVIGLFVGIDLIFVGLFWIRLSLISRK